MTDSEASYDMPVDPKEIQAKIESTEGQVFKTELTQYGKWISEKEYELRKLQAYETHCRMRFQEFLGTPLSDEQRAYFSKLEEWISIWEGNNNCKKGEKAKCL